MHQIQCWISLLSFRKFKKFPQLNYFSEKFSFRQLLHSCVSFNPMLLSNVDKIFKNTMNQFILFVTSFLVKKIVISLLYMICKQIYDSSFFFHIKPLFSLFLAFILISNIDISVNHSKNIRKALFTQKRKTIMKNCVQISLNIFWVNWSVRQTVFVTPDSNK